MIKLSREGRVLIGAWLAVRLIDEGASTSAKTFLGLGDIKTCKSFPSEQAAIEFANARADALETWVVYKPQHVYTGIVHTQVHGMNLDKVVWPAEASERSEDLAMSMEREFTRCTMEEQDRRCKLSEGHSGRCSF